jgi:hypothetical protein
LTTDFDHFVDRSLFFEEENFPLTLDLFSIEVEECSSKAFRNIFIKKAQEYVRKFHERIRIKPYQVPGTHVLLDKSTPVLIPVLKLQRDPEYFPDPLKFDPKTFSQTIW